MNPGNWSFDPLANYSNQTYEQNRCSNVPLYEDQQGNNIHSAGATYKSGVIFQSPLHQTNNEVVYVAAQDPEVNRIQQLFDNFDIFRVDATEEAKICHHKICPLILSKQFQFCLLMRMGPKAKRCFRDWPFVYFSGGLISHLIGDYANNNK